MDESGWRVRIKTENQNASQIYNNLYQIKGTYILKKWGGEVIMTSKASNFTNLLNLGEFLSNCREIEKHAINKTTYLCRDKSPVYLWTLVKNKNV